MIFMLKYLLGSFSLYCEFQRLSFGAILSDRTKAGCFQVLEGGYGYSLIIIHAVQQTFLASYTD